MAYVIPTAADLKIRYPSFSAVPDATINAYIASAQVDTSWLEADYAVAIMAYAAWAMTNNGIGAGGEIAGYIGQGVSRLKSGTLDVSFADSATSATGYDTNAYGREYALLLRKNKGGPRVIVGPRCDPYWAATGILNNGGLVPWEQ